MAEGPGETVNLHFWAAPALLACTCTLTGCATADRLVEIKVPIPVECRETEPQRPAMDTETLKPDARIDEQSRAMRAEIEAREGYEDRLRTALRNCIAPVKP